MKKMSAGVIKNGLQKISLEKKIAYQYVLTTFLLERMVARLTRDSFLYERLVFKGGYVGLRIFNSPRFTIDLDALINGAQGDKVEAAAIKALENDIEDGVWFKYEKRSDLQTLGEYGGVRLYIRAGVGKLPLKLEKAQLIHLDLGIGDAVTPSPVMSDLLELLGGESISWNVYNIETATAEKLHTLIMRGTNNSRSKDVFDLYHFLPQCNVEILKKALRATFKSRGDRLPDSIHEVISKIDKDLLKKGWKNATTTLPKQIDFEEVFAQIENYCKGI